MTIDKFLVYLLLSSTIYWLILSPFKRSKYRVIQLIVILIYYGLLLFKYIKLDTTQIFISFNIFFLLIVYPLILRKKILLAMKEGDNDKILKLLKKFFILTFRFDFLKSNRSFEPIYYNHILQNKIYKKKYVLKLKYTPYLTYFLTIPILIIYFLSFKSDIYLFNLSIINFGGNIPQFIDIGEYYRFITSIFLHVDPTHLFMNLIALIYLGSILERFITKNFFITLFILGGTFGSFLSYLINYQNSIGASGAIFSLMGGLIVVIYKDKAVFDKEYKYFLIKNIIFIVVMNLLIGIIETDIDSWAHIGGTTFGMIFTHYFYKKWNSITFISIFLSVLILLGYSIYGVSNYFIDNYSIKSLNFEKKYKIKKSGEIWIYPNLWSVKRYKNYIHFKDPANISIILDIDLKFNYKSIDFKAIEEGMKIENIGIDNFKKSMFTIGDILIFSIEFRYIDKNIYEQKYYFSIKDKLYLITSIVPNSIYDRYKNLLKIFLEKNIPYKEKVYEKE